MLSVKSCLFVGLLIPLVAAQNPVSQLISDALSLYTEATSVIESLAAATLTASSDTSSTPSSTSASTTASSSSVSSTSSEGSTTTLSSSPIVILPSSTSDSSSSTSTSTRSSTTLSTGSGTLPTSSTPTVAAAATTSSATLPSSSTNHHDRNLAIILGCVLGALALGLLLLALLLCCRRRRRSRSPQHRPLSPEDDEVDSWRVNPPGIQHGSGYGSNRELVSGAAATGAAPLMSEHPAFRNHAQHENPFVPVPPPPRRSAPNARAGLTDAAIPGDEPFLTDGRTGRPLSSKDLSRYSDSHKSVALAGLGGAAVGAAAVHHHNKNKNHELDEKRPYVPATAHTINRKPVPTHNDSSTSLDRANEKEVWPFQHDLAMPPAAGRQSNESSRSRPSRDAARANAAFDQQYSNIPSGDNNDNQPLMAGAAGIGAGVLAGAALAHHSHTRSRSSSISHSRSPHRRTPPGGIRDFRGESDLSDSSNYSDALPGQPRPTLAPKSGNTAWDLASVHSERPYEVPPPPTIRSRRNSALGTAAPVAAAAAYSNRDPSSNRSRQSSASSLDRRPRDSILPSTQRRTSGLANEVPQSASTSAPFRSQLRVGTPPLRRGGIDTYSSSSSFDNEHELALGPNHDNGRGIVGDNGYPHLGAPHRQSGSHVPFIPDLDTTRTSSDDSTWRLSSGMPGGWQRSQTPGSRRNSQDASGPVSPIGRHNSPWANARDSGVSGMSSSGGKRLRLADLQREEEEREREREAMIARGRGGSGTGNALDGFDDYGNYYGHGVGQAL